MEYVYLTKEDILEYHSEIINEIGGIHGTRDEQGIESAVEFIQNDVYYPTMVDKLTYLVFSLCSGHYFMDGNKRISIVAAAHFLIKNKKLWAGARFFEYFHAYAWHIAAGNIDKDLFSRIVDCYLNNREMDESLKLEVMHAMSQGKLFDEEGGQNENE